LPLSTRPERFTPKTLSSQFPTGIGGPSVAWNGTRYLVAWEDTRNAASDIYGTRVSAAGSPSEPTGLPISTATAAQTTAAVGSDGTNFLTTWTDARS